MPKPVKKFQRPSDESMLRAAQDLIEGNCEAADRLNFFCAVSHHIALESSASAEDAQDRSIGMFLALSRSEFATEAGPSPRQAGRGVAKRSIQVVSGNMPPLSSQQRRLVEMFVWYLRQLPEWNDGSWNSQEYEILNKLLFRFFRAKNPTWYQHLKSGKYYVEELPEKDCDEYNDLMHNAGCLPDPSVARRLKLIELAQYKQRILKQIGRYESDRNELGLGPDMTLPRKPATAIEKCAAETWGDERR